MSRLVAFAYSNRQSFIFSGRFREKLCGLSFAAGAFQRFLLTDRGVLSPKNQRHFPGERRGVNRCFCPLMFFPRDEKGTGTPAHTLSVQINVQWQQESRLGRRWCGWF